MILQIQKRRKDMNYQGMVNGKAVISKILTLSLALCLTGSALVSTSAAQDASTNDNAGQDPSASFSADDLDNLLAPIALYPDPLLAQVLVAATFDDQIQDAAQAISADGGAATIDEQSWDDSVKVVAHYPRVLFTLAAQPDWTNSVGQAYASQSTDVMASVQRLRAMALSQGNLVTTAQQRVIAVGGAIQILPAQLGYVCLPTYDPGVVFSSPAFISFGPALAINTEWEGQIDWHSHQVFDHHHHSMRTGYPGRRGRLSTVRGGGRGFNPRDRQPGRFSQINRGRNMPGRIDTSYPGRNRAQYPQPKTTQYPQPKTTRYPQPKTGMPTKPSNTPKSTATSKPVKPTTSAPTKTPAAGQKMPKQTKTAANKTASMGRPANNGSSSRSFFNRGQASAPAARVNRSSNPGSGRSFFNGGGMNRGQSNLSMNRGGGGRTSGRGGR